MGNRGRPPHAELLTPRESEVVKLVADGLTNFEIGERLGITGDAVRYHLKQVYQKLCLESREALVAWSRERRGWNAVRRALISVPAGLSAKGLLKVGAATAALGGAAAVVALGFGMAPFATSESCEIESPIIADNWTVTCVETLADLEDTFRRPLYPSEGYPVSPATGARAARVRPVRHPPSDQWRAGVVHPLGRHPRDQRRSVRPAECSRGATHGAARRAHGHQWDGRTHAGRYRLAGGAA